MAKIKNTSSNILTRVLLIVLTGSFLFFFFETIQSTYSSYTNLQKEIELNKAEKSEIQNQINNAKRSDYKGNYGVSFGNSLAHISDFDFKDGSTIRVWCSEWDHSNEEVKNYLYEDSLAVNLSSKEQIDFVHNEGYE